MELGNMLFGTGQQKIPIPNRRQWEAAFRVLLLEPLLSQTQDLDEVPTYANEIFVIRPYYWGDCTCGAEEKDQLHNPTCGLLLPNFVYKPKNFKMDWYKYPLRDAHMSEKITYEEFCRILKICATSI